MSNLWKMYSTTAEKYCKHVGPENFNYSLNISFKYKYMYVETPKVACSSIKSTLQRMELEDPGLYSHDFEDLHNRNFSPLIKAQQVGDLDAFMKREDIFRFCFVRNPYTRLLSSYLDKIQGNRPQKVQVLRQLGFGQDSIDMPVSFDEFVAAVIEQPIYFMDHHWRHQYYQTFQGAVVYDFVGRFERLDHELPEVLGRITSDYEKYLTTEERHSQNTVNLISEYYTRKTRRQVYAKFEQDFSFFGYSEKLPG